MVVLVAWTVLITIRPLEWMDQLAGALGGYAVVATAALAIRAWIRHRTGTVSAEPDAEQSASDLARTLKAQWADEARARSVGSPHLLPFAWRVRDARPVRLPSDAGESANAVTSQAAIHAGAITGVTESGPSVLTRTTSDRPRLGTDRVSVGGGPGIGSANERDTWDVPDGRVTGPADSVSHRLAATYRSLGTGRLLVLGEPGAGKSALAILLVLGLLAERTDGDPVPVLLGAASWDPVTQPFDEWVVDTLATTHYDNRRDVPTMLWRRGLLLPVLDGLDEIMESARGMAITGIHDALGTDHPVVITCRIQEYDDVIRAGSPSLHSAPVVQMLPVRPADVRRYLDAVPWPPETSWGEVLRMLALQPDHPVSAALSTPLMVSLARRIYRGLGGDPSEMLTLPNRYAVEHHVLGRVVPAAYSQHRLPSGETAGPPGRWTAAQAERWLRFLARHLHASNRRDLAWWELPDHLLSLWAGPIVTLFLGIVVMCGTALGGHLVRLGIPATSDLPSTLDLWLVGAYVGLMFWLVGMLLWYAVSTRPPGRLSWSAPARGRAFRHGLVAGTVIVAFPIGLALAAAAIVVSLDDVGWTFARKIGYVRWAVAALTVDVVAGIAIGVHSWLGAPPALSRRADPQGSLRNDRWSSLVGATVAGLVVGLLASPCTAVTVVAASLAMGWPGRPVNLDDAWDWTSGWLDRMAAAAIVGIPAVVVGMLVLTTRAWTRLLITRLQHVGRQRLPVRLMTFLDDARRRGVLRISGDRYQFAHVRLQEHLALEPPATWTERQAAADHARERRRRAGIGAALTALLILGVAVTAVPKDQADDVLPPPAPGVGAVSWLAAVPGRPVLVARYEDGSVWVWPDGLRTGVSHHAVRLDNRCPETRQYQDAGPEFLAASANRIVSSCDHGSVLAWQRHGDDGRWVRTPQPPTFAMAGTLTVAVTDQALLSLAQDGSVALDPWPRTAGPGPHPRRTNLLIRPILDEASRDAELALSDDGRRLAVLLLSGSSSSSALYVWDMGIATTQLAPIARLGNPIRGLGFSVGGDRLNWCTGSGLDGISLARQPKSAKPAAYVAAPTNVGLPSPAACVHDGARSWIMTRSGNDVRVRDIAAAAAPWRTLHGHLSDGYPGYGDWDHTLTVAHAPTDQRPVVAAGAQDGSIRIWDL